MPFFMETDEENAPMSREQGNHSPAFAVSWGERGLPAEAVSNREFWGMGVWTKRLFAKDPSLRLLIFIESVGEYFR
jgi:hypothetical protein